MYNALQTALLMSFEQHFYSIDQWLVNHGFLLNNREWASLAWLSLIIIGILSFAAINSEFRRQLAGIFKMAFFSKLAFIWIIYVLWIGLFVILADYFGYWRPMLTKAALVWAATTGIGSLVGFSEAQNLGYFKSAMRNSLRIVAVFVYFIGFASFSFLLEFAIQPIIFLIMVAPIIDSNSQRLWNQIGFVCYFILLVVMAINSGFFVYSTWTNLDLGLILRQILLPVILSIWILGLVLPLSISSSYEQVFTNMRIFRNQERGLWKVKIGVILALKHRLKYIREAEKGGAEITRAARADTVEDAYREARKLVEE